MTTHYAVAYYKICNIENPHLEVKKHKNFFKDHDIKGRIYLSEQGINGQISTTVDGLAKYKEWMESQEIFTGIQYKTHDLSEHIFDRMTVKYRKELVAVDLPIDFSKVGKHISPAEWRKTLEEDDENLLVIDVRNDYEGKVGHFEKAIIPPLKTFREFPDYVEKLKEKYDPKKTKVLMYCTGGIRCEFFSPLMKQAGYDDVNQLDGGVIDYGLKEGNKHWKGKLFVFDDRLVTPISNDNAETISTCELCQKSCDRYINCANMDCNKLFIACEECINEHKGLCSAECEKGRVRPFDHKAYPKPFRRQSFEEKQALKKGCSSCC